MDESGFDTAREALVLRIQCVGERLPAAALGRAHRAQALGAFLGSDDLALDQALAGMLAADPGHQLPPALVPDGHPIRAHVSAAGALVRDQRRAPLPTPSDGHVEVDGIRATDAPAARAVVLQHVDAAGAVRASGYRWPGEPLDDWLAVPAAPVAAVVVPAAPPPAERKSLRTPLLIATGASALGTGVLAALAAGAHADFEDTSQDRTEEDLRALQGRANGLSWGWVAGAAVTAGLGVGVAVTW
jgi:hypothetical protein